MLYGASFSEIDKCVFFTSNNDEDAIFFSDTLYRKLGIPPTLMEVKKIEGSDQYEFVRYVY